MTDRCKTTWTLPTGATVKPAPTMNEYREIYHYQIDTTQGHDYLFTVRSDGKRLIEIVNCWESTGPGLPASEFEMRSADFRREYGFDEKIGWARSDYRQKLRVGEINMPPVEPIAKGYQVSEEKRLIIEIARRYYEPITSKFADFLAVHYGVAPHQLGERYERAWDLVERGGWELRPGCILMDSHESGVPKAARQGVGNLKYTLNLRAIHYAEADDPHWQNHQCDCFDHTGRAASECGGVCQHIAGGLVLYYAGMIFLELFKPVAETGKREAA